MPRKLKSLQERYSQLDRLEKWVVSTLIVVVLCTLMLAGVLYLSFGRQPSESSVVAMELVENTLVTEAAQEPTLLPTATLLPPLSTATIVFEITPFVPSTVVTQAPTVSISEVQQSVTVMTVNAFAEQVLPTVAYVTPYVPNLIIQNDLATDAAATPIPQVVAMARQDCQVELMIGANLYGDDLSRRTVDGGVARLVKLWNDPQGANLYFDVRIEGSPRQYFVLMGETTLGNQCDLTIYDMGVFNSRPWWVD